jgi:hypothetical protein
MGRGGWGRGDGVGVVSACVSLVHIASLMLDFQVPAPAMAQSMPPPPPPELRACARPGCAFAAHTAQASQGNVSHCCMQCQRDGSHSISCQRFPRPIAAAAGVYPSTSLLHSVPSAPPASSEPECQICMSEAATHAAVPCGHRVLCAACHAATPLAECPICRAVVTAFLRIY